MLLKLRHVLMTHDECQDSGSVRLQRAVPGCRDQRMYVRVEEDEDEKKSRAGPTCKRLAWR